MNESNSESNGETIGEVVNEIKLRGLFATLIK